jgi:hypothetical protein
MNAKRLQIIQLLLEAGIPIFGMLFWNWNLAFILFYYVFDWLASTLLTGAKIKKCIDYLGGGIFRSNWYLFGFISITLILPSLVFANYFLNNVSNDFSFFKEFERFFFYKDMGIEQGYLLLPLVLLNAWTQYRMQFLITQAHTRTNELAIVKKYLLQNGLILIGILLCFGISAVVQLNEWIYIGILLLSTSTFRFFVRT